MSRSSVTTCWMVLSAIPLLGVAAQQIDVRPAPSQGCTGAPTADSTIYDADEASPGPQLRSFRRLEMPTALREAGGKGGVTLAYVVNADGRIDSSNVVVMTVSDSAFIAPARATVLGSRFWPGCRSGVPVRVQVTQSFGFEAKNYDSRGFLIRPKRGG
ncbi:MAG: energy transducer TonB [Gemmatimonadetes bacterium]|nr:energy transducer TonB [Gemmatimonadota bacterium]